jgi:hypothetical protein
VTNRDYRGRGQDRYSNARQDGPPSNTIELVYRALPRGYRQVYVPRLEGHLYYHPPLRRILSLPAASLLTLLLAKYREFEAEQPDYLDANYDSAPFPHAYVEGMGMTEATVYKCFRELSGFDMDMRCYDRHEFAYFDSDMGEGPTRGLHYQIGFRRIVEALRDGLKPLKVRAQEALRERPGEGPDPWRRGVWIV